MTSSTRTGRLSPARSGHGPVRIAAAVVMLLLALAGSAGTVAFGLLAQPPFVGWSIVALLGHAVLLGSLPAFLRGRRWAWTVALCWAVALAHWGLYKVLVEGELESLAFTSAEALVLVLLLVPAGRPDEVRPNHVQPAA